ncbi:hypothetical protein AAFG13_37770 [Bradyrhizobium sp. B124]|uniref:hypothetical protein n=1 Tax=Bradyrhizobium sp. B124 TaxID=3140245 RepID=UPI00318339AA
MRAATSNFIEDVWQTPSAALKSCNSVCDWVDDIGVRPRPCCDFFGSAALHAEVDNGSLEQSFASDDIDHGSNSAAIASIPIDLRIPNDRCCDDVIDGTVWRQLSGPTVVDGASVGRLAGAGAVLPGRYAKIPAIELASYFRADPLFSERRPARASQSRRRPGETATPMASSNRYRRTRHDGIVSLAPPTAVEMFQFNGASVGIGWQ